MANSDKCPRCECEGNRLACEMCYYFGFRCPGNCECCADTRASTHTQVRVSNCNVQKVSTQRQGTVSNANGKRAPTKRRTPLRPLILRNCRKATAANDQKKATSDVSQPKVENSTTSESSTNNGPPTGSNLSADKVELGFPPHIKKYIQKDNEERERLWHRLFWPQYEKVPCEPPVANQNAKPIIISQGKLKEGINELIGDHCLNCNCRNPREPCDICRHCDFQCLGSCMCCLPYRAGQRYMVFVTRGVFQLADGSYYGGGSVNLSYTVPDNSENHCEDNMKAQKKSLWVRTIQAIQASIYLLNLSRAVTAASFTAFFVFIVIALNRNKTHLSEMLMRMRHTLLNF